MNIENEVFGCIFLTEFVGFNEFLIFIHKFKQKKFLGTFILLSRGSGWFLTDINTCLDLKVFNEHKNPSKAPTSLKKHLKLHFNTSSYTPKQNFSAPKSFPWRFSHGMKESKKVKIILKHKSITYSTMPPRSHIKN